MSAWLWLVSIAFAGPVQFPAADGVVLSGTSWGSGSRGVVLVHDEARSQADFATLGARLGRSGYHVLAIDLRGHGASAKAPTAGEDWSPLVADINGAVSWLSSRGATEIDIVGVRLGANLALQAAASNPAIRDLALIAPTPNAHGVKVASAAPALAGRPTLLVASSQDILSVRAAKLLEGASSGASSLMLLDGLGSSQLLSDSPELESQLVVWLGADRAPVTTSALPSKAGELRTGPSDIRTTGVPIDQR